MQKRLAKQLLISDLYIIRKLNLTVSICMFSLLFSLNVMFTLYTLVIIAFRLFSEASLLKKSKRRAFLHGGGVPLVGEVTGLGGVTRLSI